MPPRRRSTRRRASSRKPRTWRHHAGKALSLATRSGIKALKKKLGLNTENKNYDLQVNQATSATLSALFYPTINLAQGTTNSTRNGNGIRITHWKFQGSITTSNLNSVGQRVRIMVTYQPSMTTAGSEVSNTQLLQVSSDLESMLNSDLEDCRVIYDKTFTLTPQYSGQILVKPFKIKWNPSYDAGHVQWTDADTTGVTAHVLKGLIKVFCMTDQGANFPSITGRSRVHYVDN